MLNKETIERALGEIKKEVKDSKISERNLVKFGTSKDDRRFFSYINSPSSYYLKGIPLLLNKLGLKNIVELGNREGVSTLCMWDKLAQDAKITTIDIVKDLRYCPDEMFNDPRVRIIYGDVSDLSIFKGDIPMDIDFLFSDTIHYNFQVTDEFEIYQYFLSDTALFAIDDIYVNDKNLFFEKVVFSKWDLTELFHCSGWGLFLYERKENLTKEQRILKAYQASAKVWKRKADENNARFEKLNNKRPLVSLKKIVKSIRPLYRLYTITYNNLSAFYKNKRFAKISDK